MKFLEKYPPPWRLENTYYEEEGSGAPGEGRIVASNGAHVIASYDNDGYESGLSGDVEELIEFINNL